VPLSCAALVLTALPAAAAGNVKVGADVYSAECAECHSTRPNKNKKGPSLFGVVGRRAAELPDAKYSEAMQRSGWVWDADTLRRYLHHPRAALPGGTMKYDGLRDAQALEDLVAYLATIK
jgi:cytochrome c